MVKVRATVSPVGNPPSTPPIDPTTPVPVTPSSPQSRRRVIGLLLILLILLAGVGRLVVYPAWAGSREFSAGKELLEQHDLPEALAALKRADAIRPSHLETQYLLAQTSRRRTQKSTLPSPNQS